MHSSFIPSIPKLAEFPLRMIQTLWTSCYSTRLNNTNAVYCEQHTEGTIRNRHPEAFETLNQKYCDVLCIVHEHNTAHRRHVCTCESLLHIIALHVLSGEDIFTIIIKPSPSWMCLAATQALLQPVTAVMINLHLRPPLCDPKD